MAVMSGPGSSRRGRRRSAAKRQQIVDAATALFTEQGIETASMTDVAERAGVARQTVYSYFADKESLFAEVVAQIRQGLTAGGAEPETGRDGERSGRRLLGDTDILVALAGLGSYLVNTLTDPQLSALRREAVSRGTEGVWAAWALDGPDELKRALAAELNARPELDIPDPDLAVDHYLGLVLHRPIMDTLRRAPRPADPAGYYRVTDACVAFLRAYAARD
jgi:TetR/AcrR family transcriptional regulator, mexJK operon transcriptional repressor